MYRLDKNKLNLTTVNYQENISEEVKRIARIALERGQDAIKNRKSSTGGPTMEEIEKELGGIDGFFTMFGCHYVGMFSNPRMNVLFDTSHKNDANSNALDHGKRVASSLLDLKFGTTYFGSLGRSHHLARVAVQGSHMKVKISIVVFYFFNICPGHALGIWICGCTYLLFWRRKGVHVGGSEGGGSNVLDFQ